MKKIKNTLKVLVVVMFVSFAYTVEAQPPGGGQGPPPPSGGSGGTTNSTSNSLGGNAPIGGGLFILLGLGAAYGSKKIYSLKLKEEKN